MEKRELVEGKVDWKGRTALKRKHGGMRTALMILAAFGFENMAAIALAVNFVTYFNGILHFELADAATELTYYMGTSYFLIILGPALPLYRIHVANGTSVIVEIIQVYVAAIRNSKLELPENPIELFEVDREVAGETEFLPYRDIYRFLDKATVQTPFTEQSGAPNPWKLYHATQVENAKIILGMTPVFLCTIIMALCLAQLQNFYVQQGLTMDTRITGDVKIPPASLPIIPVAFLVTIIPFYDQVVVPFHRKLRGHPTGITHLQRIGIGLVLSSQSMAAAAIMESKRKAVARDHYKLNAIPVLQHLPICVFWLSFQYFIFRIADMFTYVGLLEFFYSEAPKALKSVSTCFLWTSMALGYSLSTILVKIVNAATKNVTASRGWLAGNNINTNYLDLFYALLSVISLISFCVYLVVALRYKYRPQMQTAAINGA